MCASLVSTGLQLMGSETVRKAAVHYAAAHHQVCRVVDWFQDHT